MDQAKIISVNVGEPREVLWKGTRVSTGIFKYPVDGRVKVNPLNLRGDRQADLSVHGGPYKAIYGYPSEHYPYWRKELPQADLRGARLARTSPPRVFSKTNSTLATSCTLAPLW